MHDAREVRAWQVYERGIAVGEKWQSGTCRLQIRFIPRVMAWKSQLCDDRGYGASPRTGSGFSSWEESRGNIYVHS